MKDSASHTGLTDEISRICEFTGLTGVIPGLAHEITGIISGLARDITGLIPATYP